MNKVLLILSVLLICGAGMFVYAARQRAKVIVQQSETVATTVLQSEKFALMFDSPPFELTDQNGRPLTNRDLAGKVWIADFIFTNCAGPCPVMTSKLSEVAKKIAGTDVKLVSFTVDPKRDTPEVLKEFSKPFGVDDSRWSFATGSVQQMQSVAVGMHIAAQEETDQSVTHSTQFLLVNRQGQVCGIYRMNDEDVVTKLAADALELSKK